MNKEIDLHKFPKMNKLRWMIPALESLLCINQCNDILNNLPQTEDMIAVIDKILCDLQIKVSCRGLDNAKLKEKQPLLVVSNHPFGGIDGLIIAKLLLEKGCEVKILANFLLAHMKSLSSVFISVNPFIATSDSNTISGIKAAHKWLAQNGTLIVFPSGTVSHWHWNQRKICDPVWHHSAVRLAHQHNASILPLFVHGKNHWSFYLAGLISPKLRTLLLPRQLFNQPNREIKVSAATLITSTELSQYGDYSKQTEHLRQMVYQASRN